MYVYAVFFLSGFICFSNRWILLFHVNPIQFQSKIWQFNSIVTFQYIVCHLWSVQFDEATTYNSNSGCINVSIFTFLVFFVQYAYFSWKNIYRAGNYVSNEHPYLLCSVFSIYSLRPSTFLCYPSIKFYLGSLILFFLFFY